MVTRRLQRVGGALAAAAVAAIAAAAPAFARTVNDPLLPRQWGLSVIGAPAAWDRATGAGTIIAVVDSGVDLQHEDLASKLLPGRDYTGNGSVQDDCGHGTHVSGIAAAATDNGRGIAGVAPDAKILPVKVLVPSGTTCGGSINDVSNGIMWAADQGATVINLSLGSDIQFLTGSDISPALQYAWDKGSIPVVAAGNQYILGSGYSNESAIIVAATGPTDNKPSYSSGVGGAKWGMAAPGGNGNGDDNDILSTYFIAGKTNQYALDAGTSMATPHVAGAAAVLRSMGLTKQQTVDRLLGTAKNLGNPSVFGAGRLDLAKAVAAGGGTAPPPTVSSAGSSSRSGPAGSPTTQRRGGSSAAAPGVVANHPSPVGTGSAIGPAPVVTATPPPPDTASTEPAIPQALAPPKPLVAVNTSHSGDGEPVGLLALGAVALLGATGWIAWTIRARRAQGG